MDQVSGRHDFEVRTSSSTNSRGDTLNGPILWRFAPDSWCEQWVSLFLSVGVVLRLIRFLLPFPLWFDEYQLAENLLVRDFGELTQPLDNTQVAPVGFLWTVHASTLAFGFHEWSLRLFPCICGIASLFLMRRIAARLLTGASQVFAVGVLAVSYYPIRLGSEVKPYAGDLLCSLLLLGCLVEWRHDQGRSRWLWTLCGLIVPTLLLSFPAAFVGGATSLAVGALLIADWRTSGRFARRQVVAWLFYNILLVGAFIAILAFNAASQHRATADEMLRYWSDTFPPLADPRALAVWLLKAHTSEIFALPVGSENGGSILSALGCLVGAMALWRKGPRWLIGWAAALFGLNFVAAALERYPYGGHARLAQHLAPVVSLFLAAGVGALVDAIGRVEWRAHATRLACAGCLLLAVGTVARDVATPYKTASNQIHQGFDRWFWQSAGDIPIVCVEDDLGHVLYGTSLRSVYRCYRALHQPPGALRNEAARKYVESAAGPVRCVVFHSSSARRDDVAFAAWRRGMESHYTLAGQSQHVIVLGVPGEDVYDFHKLCYDVYDFIPNGSESATPAAIHPLAESPERTLRR